MITHIRELLFTLKIFSSSDIVGNSKHINLSYCRRHGGLSDVPKEHIIKIVGLLPSSGLMMCCIRMPKNSGDRGPYIYPSIRPIDTHQSSFLRYFMMVLF